MKKLILKINLIFLIISSLSCGKIEVKHKIEDKPKVEHNLNINIDILRHYFSYKCFEELPNNHTLDELNFCINDKIYEFKKITGI